MQNARKFFCFDKKDLYSSFQCVILIVPHNQIADKRKDVFLLW